MAAQQQDIWSSESKKKDIDNINQMLAGVASSRITVQEAFEYRTDGGIRIALPQEPGGKKMELEVARDAIQEEIDNQARTYEFSKFFYCKPQDGAWAFNAMFKELWKTPTGKATEGWFARPPQMMAVKVGIDEEYYVPWGTLEFSPWKTTFELEAQGHPEYGMGFSISAYGQKKYEPVITGFFMLLEKYIKENSIYRTKAMQQVTGDPQFCDVYKVDRETASFAQVTFWELMDQVWGIIKFAEKFREANAGYPIWEFDEAGEYKLDDEGQKIPVYELTDAGKPRMHQGQPVQKTERTHIRIGNNVLLRGENGTGKTMAAAITGQYCMEYGWTFVEAMWNEPLPHVMRFVEHIGGPACIVIEDVENLFVRPGAMQQLLGEFDGLRSKGQELMLLMTTNHEGEIPKSMTGGHRIDHTIYVSALDTPGVERLINSHIPESQRLKLDYDAVYAAVEGYMPAYIVRSFEDVTKHSIIRTGDIGRPHATEDFVRAANAKRATWQLHQESTDRPEQPELVRAIANIVAEQLRAHMVDLSDGEIMVRD